MMQKQSMRNFLDRENACVEYISKREKDRTAEVKQRQALIEAAELKEKESASTAPAEPPGADKGPTAAQKQEAEYQHLEKQFRAKLAPQAAAKAGMLSRASSSRHMTVKGVS
ncbi:dynein intermediate chain [Klebsormidium nitens]|uniref:Dynein intermediate chain n=1 Tax=Klebsormidium nitens TaxID=105231 RepID=A0A1Y1HPY8_KLENI|nr:dynein intermediate chain [Klebsormidium nitens]|eukprot:GAQ79842.1 dynein intermediate chain [Klebsormidium nitens]